MKVCLAVLCVVVVVAVTEAHPVPQKDGQIFSNEAIRQAQNTFLIPKDATIQKVSSILFWSPRKNQCFQQDPAGPNFAA